MKKCLSVVPMLALMLVSCGDKTQEQVRDFAIGFAQKVSKNQVDSLKDVFPEVEHFDSLALTVVTDSIIVKETGKENEFLVSLGNGSDITVVKDGEGKMKVTSSHGLLAIDKETMDFAKKTGQWKEGLTDAALAERLSDDQFKQWLISAFEKRMKEYLKVEGKPEIAKKVTASFLMDGLMGVTIRNTSNFPISGKDYYVVFEGVFAIQGYYEEDIAIEKGKDLGPSESITITTRYNDNHSWNKAYVKFKMGNKELFEKYFNGLGNEYEEYLKDSNKQV